ncbi:hypothetical protein BCR43DRAFT_433787 [Syncephalastrum racemosum]|uniref:Anp1-domain-containing protein n=1 Tax=Syncephalastrum racemosum TaxID=13706 RepID=A0A1X2HLG1_SYNRA|nr:hypothetical protein BCR43DRAFT_433787 [Syncephalastrum racemosum]
MSYYLNLNGLNASAEASQRGERLLVLTPIQHDGVEYLERYFELLERTTYPNDLISVGLLVTDGQDTMDAVQRVVDAVEARQHRWYDSAGPAFHEIIVYDRHFTFEIPIRKQDAYEEQPYRRSMMARARNFLLSSALRDYHSWVAWVDVDLVEYPATIFDDLMRADVDVIVPNCLMARADNQYWAYDKNNWQETDYSLEKQKWIDPDFILMEGFDNIATGRTLLVDMPTHLGDEHKVPLDGVGATFTLVKSHVHREGANFPAFGYQHEIDSEAFGKVARSMGFSVYGIPSYRIYHAEKDTIAL